MKMKLKNNTASEPRRNIGSRGSFFWFSSAVSDLVASEPIYACLGLITPWRSATLVQIKLAKGEPLFWVRIRNTEYGLYFFIGHTEDTEGQVNSRRNDCWWTITQQLVVVVLFFYDTFLYYYFPIISSSRSLIVCGSFSSRRPSQHSRYILTVVFLLQHVTLPNQLRRNSSRGANSALRKFDYLFPNTTPFGQRIRTCLLSSRVKEKVSLGLTSERSG